MAHSIDRLFEESTLTARDLADSTGLERARIEAILAGRWLPTPAERQKISAALGVQPEDVDWGHTMSPRNVRYHRFGLPDDRAQAE